MYTCKQTQEKNLHPHCAHVASQMHCKRDLYTQKRDIDTHTKPYMDTIHVQENLKKRPISSLHAHELNLYINTLYIHPQTRLIKTPYTHGRDNSVSPSLFLSLTHTLSHTHAHTLVPPLSLHTPLFLSLSLSLSNHTCEIISLFSF